MLSLTTLITPESVKVATELTSQKKAFETLSKLLTPMGMNITNQIYDGLLKREKLGSTAIGNGIAIPHARIEGIENPKVAVIKTGGITTEAPDNLPVEILFGIIVPAGDNQAHLNLLAELSALLKKGSFTEELKAADNEKSIYNALLLATVNHDAN